VQHLGCLVKHFPALTKSENQILLPAPLPSGLVINVPEQ